MQEENHTSATERRRSHLVYALAAAGALVVGGAGLVFERLKAPAQQEAAVFEPEAPSGKFLRHAAPRNLPQIAFTDKDGRRHVLREWRGKVVLLNIWATWCPPCVREMPALDKLQADKGGDDFAVLSISTDRSGLPKPDAFYKRVGIKNLALFNEASGALSEALDADRLPLTIIVDRQGREVARYFGSAEWDSAEVFAKVMTMAGEKSAAPRR